MRPMSGTLSLGRRHFFKTTALGVAGVGLARHGGLAAKDGQAELPPKIREYRTLGRTGFKVSNIDACRACGAPCEAACPHGVPIQGMLVGTHDLLTMAWKAAAVRRALPTGSGASLKEDTCILY
jgi:ferredoxin